jgi:hypothetical protein
MNNKKLQAWIGLLVVLSIAGLLIWLFITLFNWFFSLKSDLAVGILTASTTVIVATATLVLGRYFERVKEAEAFLRAQKIEMYDGFLKEFFGMFHGEEKSSEDNVQLVKFLQEWQRKLVVWGGAPVLLAFVKWKIYLASHEPDANTVFLMDEFFRAMRNDIGLSNNGLEKGFFSHLILRSAPLFLMLAKSNPNIKLADLAEIEKNLGSN